MNKIPGVQIDTVEAAHFADDFASKMTNNIINRNAKLQEMASQMDGTVDKINQLKGEFGVFVPLFYRGCKDGVSVYERI